MLLKRIFAYNDTLFVELLPDGFHVFESFHPFFVPRVVRLLRSCIAAIVPYPRCIELGVPARGTIFVLASSWFPMLMYVLSNGGQFVFGFI